MSGLAVVAARVAVYVTLAAAFGIPLQALVDGWRVRRRWMMASVSAAMISSIAALLVLVASMAGTAILPVDGEMLWMVLAETPVGAAFSVRFAALFVAILGGWRGGRGGTIIVCASSAVALATVAWTGHGAMQDGTAGRVHLTADIVHAMAGTAWIGAIATLSLRLFVARRDRTALHDAVAALHRFALAGSVLAATVIVTGAINGWMIAGADLLAILPSTLYGQLMIAKLAAFAVMLTLAARHRWILVPRLRDAVDQGECLEGSRSLLHSLGLELLCGVSILVIVAWLGTLSPAG